MHKKGYSDAVAFLFSDSSRFITGQGLVVDGAFTRDDVGARDKTS